MRRGRIPTPSERALLDAFRHERTADAERVARVLARVRGEEPEGDANCDPEEPLPVAASREPLP